MFSCKHRSAILCCLINLRIYPNFLTSLWPEDQIHTQRWVEGHMNWTKCCGPGSRSPWAAELLPCQLQGQALHPVLPPVLLTLASLSWFQCTLWAVFGSSLLMLVIVSLNLQSCIKPPLGIQEGGFSLKNTIYNTKQSLLQSFVATWLPRR